MAVYTTATVGAGSASRPADHVEIGVEHRSSSRRSPDRRVGEGDLPPGCPLDRGGDLGIDRRDDLGAVAEVDLVAVVARAGCGWR
jgi:hypothetical protein